MKSLGARTSTTRTADQTTAAIFWQFAPTVLYNRLARDLSTARQLDTTREARLLAMINLAAADGAISCWNDKYHWYFWRPRAAIQEAGDGRQRGHRGRPGVGAAVPRADTRPRHRSATPPFPDHPSGHGCVSGAVLRTFREFFGTNRIEFDMHSGRYPGQPRHFTSFSQAMKEVVDARVWGGIHFRYADQQGALMGKKVAFWLQKHYFRPVAPPSRSYRRTAIRAPPVTTRAAPSTRRGPTRSSLPRSSAEKTTPKSDSVATIGATIETVPR